MLSSRPLAGDNGSTHSLSDVYYIKVHLSFRGSWPRVTPRATKPDCGPNLTGTGTSTQYLRPSQLHGLNSNVRFSLAQSLRAFVLAYAGCPAPARAPASHLPPLTPF